MGEGRVDGGRPLELWAGFECTLNRVGDRYLDQLEWSGHRSRPEDLDRIRDLGARAVRYPVLWERAPDWSWTDERLERIRRLGLRPIVGLVHHGSGPRSTDLLDPAFAEGLAEHAAAVAQRYPWVDDWTPVNEPLTTARFSALYGHWYPHARDGGSFARALVNQWRGTVLAMEAIRTHIPQARLVQTEDLGHMHASRPLRYQAEFENERRWATFDALTGRLGPDLPFGRWLVESAGVSTHDLDWLRRRACPPDILGINHYLSGERIIDHRIDRYPGHMHGGNGRHRYADDLAPAAMRRGPLAILEEVWARYGLPMAVTEVQNGIHREEQLRWLLEIWRAAEAARAAGADVRAVTIWSVIGAYGWDRLCTDGPGAYETGAFDLRGGTPRPTAVAATASALASGEAPGHPVLADSGWWRADRLPLRAQPVLITGSSGTLGRACGVAAGVRNLSHRLLTRAGLDIADPRSVADALDAFRPWAVVNAAGYVRVDDAERDPAACMRENADGPSVLAAACAERGIRLVTFSSDLVFDGRSARPYVESDEVAPLNVYGRSKALAERLVLERSPEALVIRTSAFFGAADAYNFVTVTLAELMVSGRIAVDAASTISPTYVPDLVDAVLDLLVDGESGIWHVAGPTAVTWHALARRAAIACGLDPARIEAGPAPSLPAARPRYSALGSERAVLLPPLADALGRYAEARATIAAEQAA